ncbi:lipoprotein NlpD [Klebsiella pneumoniae]|uniref:Lipoprotein NlpD n=1 Tax=Klebsiella pneumoniae TaxID=573 RepID=A0A2X1QH17_KLEPN|nr:lipoprotein NlpD [Klebsiella pneumoniae]
MLITPPPSGVKSAPQAQPIQPMQTQTIQPQPAPVAQEPVQTVNGRIVYNRKYGDIPKGSYTGGSTYTVKRGDTLFYIAWVTGNDFRDLAQRNNIPAPYALNVGQYCRSVTPQASRSPAKTPFLRPAQERAAVRRPAQLLHKNRPRWLLHNRLLRILNLQVNRVLPRCCLI